MRSRRCQAGRDRRSDRTTKPASGGIQLRKNSTPAGMQRCGPRRLDAVRTLNPGYFALVMATGILSTAMYHQRAYVLSVGLLWLAGVAFVVLLCLTVIRIAVFHDEFARDLVDPSRAFGTFTFVAAADVLGTRLAIDTHWAVAFALLAIAWLTWLVLGYLVPWTAALKTSQRPALRRANGTWFIWVVASQSIAVLAATLEPALGQGRRELALLAVFSWSVGVFLYAVVGILVAARLLIYPLAPQDLTPPYWVAMGATAITVLAGARIVEMANAPMVAATPGCSRRNISGVLGFRHLVAGAVAGGRNLAPCDSSGAATLRSAAVERGVPAGHVRGWQRPPWAGRSLAHRRGYWRGGKLGRASSVGGDFRGDAAPSHADHWPFRD